MQEREIEIQYDEQSGPLEEGVEIPFDRINPDTLRNLISEFVTREWEELGNSSYTLDDKIEQVLRQLQDKKVAVMFDMKTNSCNIVLTDNTFRAV